MKTLIISTSLNPESNSLKCCKAVEKEMKKNTNNEVELINLQDYEINHVFGKVSPDAEKLTQKCMEADNFIFGFPIYNYNVSDTFASFIDGILPKKPFALYGLVLAGGGDLSFLVTSSANQMLMTHNQMMAFPKFLYTTKKDWNEDGKVSENFGARISDFCTDFVKVGEKLL